MWIHLNTLYFIIDIASYQNVKYFKIFKLKTTFKCHRSVFNKLERDLYYLILKAEHLHPTQGQIILQEGLLFKTPALGCCQEDGGK